MARKSPGKSETLTIRLDPKTRFMLEFVSRLNGQTITTVVERAISAAADGTEVRHRNQFRGDKEYETWRDFWDVIDGVRALKMATESLLHPTYEEERRLAFAHKHWPFFYTNETKTHLRPAYIEILWSRIDEFVVLDEQSKSTDFWASGKAMKQAISDAGVSPPEWPPKPKEVTSRPRPNAPAFEPGGMDDDIPF